MAGKKSQHAEEPGFDSFLDVVANLVGILIILVMLVGASAGSKWTEARTNAENSAEIEKAAKEAEARIAKAQAVKSDYAKLQGHIADEMALTMVSERESQLLEQAAILLERELESKSNEESKEKLQLAKLTQELEKTEQQIDSVMREASFIETSEKPKMTLTHYATPIAKTIFNREVHFRLSGDKISYVPMDELLDKMKTDLQLKINRLKTEGTLTEEVGPLDGFRLTYDIRVAEQVIPTNAGVVRRTYPELTKFSISPMSERAGEDVLGALAQPNSQFRMRLSKISPKETTISVWVYPDSYHSYLKLEQFLHEQGYLVASWPIPAGQPITGSPNGMKSVGQ